MDERLGGPSLPVLRGHRGLHACDRALCHRTAFRGASLQRERMAQVQFDLVDRDAVGRRQAVDDRPCGPELPLGRGGVAARQRDLSEPQVESGEVRMPGRQHLAPDGQRLLQQSLGCVDIARRELRHAMGGQGCGGPAMVLAYQFAVRAERALGKRQRFGGVAPHSRNLGDRIVTTRHRRVAIGAEHGFELGQRLAPHRIGAREVTQVEVQASQIVARLRHLDERYVETCLHCQRFLIERQRFAEPAHRVQSPSHVVQQPGGIAVPVRVRDPELGQRFPEHGLGLGAASQAVEQ
ncbi:MAG: hypothetical protein R3E65_11810 [Steroidobacteraceae bacterium]